MRLARTTLVHFVSQVGKSAAGFIVTLYLARAVGAETLGIYFVMIALVAWLTVPTNGVASAMTKRVSEGEQKKKFLSAGFLINGVLLTLISAALLVFTPHVEGYIGAPVGHLLVLLLVAQALFTQLMAGLNGQKKVGVAGLTQFFERVLRGAGQIGFVYIGYELGGIIIGHIVSLMVIGLSAFLVFDIGFQMPRKRHFESLGSYAQYSWLGTMKSRTHGWMDVIVLNFFVASSLIGIYEIAWRLSTFLVILSVSITVTVFPEISDLSSDGRSERVHGILNDALTFTGMLVIPGFVGAAVIGTEILKIYGSEFTQGGGILLVLIVAGGLDAYAKTLTKTINAVNRPDIAFRVNAAMIISNLTLNVTLIYYFGWYGAAVATTLSTAVGLVLAYRELSKIIGRPDIPMSEITKQAFSAFVMGAVIFLLSDLHTSHYYTVVLVTLGAFTYGVCLGVISEKFRNKVTSLAP